MTGIRNPWLDAPIWVSVYEHRGCCDYKARVTVIDEVQGGTIFNPHSFPKCGVTFGDLYLVSQTRTTNEKHMIGGAQP